MKLNNPKITTTMAKIRQTAAYYLRKAHLLQLADHFMLIGNVLKNRKSNQIFLNEHPDFIPPPVHLAYDAYNSTSWRFYYDTGLYHSKLISDLIREFIVSNEIKICEWGCGPARVIRHLQQIEGFEKIELLGTDFNKKSIDWCNKHTKNIRFLVNNLNPPLPIESNLFDCVYAISVFTHLSERLHYQWIKELFRIIRPNGILIFTTHGDYYAEQLSPIDKKKYYAGCLVVKGHIKEGKKLFASYHPPQWVKNELLKDSIVLKHIQNADKYHLQQEVWCAKKI